MLTSLFTVLLRLGLKKWKSKGEFCHRATKASRWVKLFCEGSYLKTSDSIQAYVLLAVCIGHEGARKVSVYFKPPWEV